MTGSVPGDSVLVEIRNATIAYRQQELFSGLNLEIRKNQHWAVVGKSGSGKSALLRALAGQYPVLKGKIAHFPPGRAKTAYLDIRHDFQPLAGTGPFFYQQRFNAGFADHALTVKDYLAEKALDTPQKSPWTLDHLTDWLRLDTIKNRHVIKLSSGEGKRLRMAAALLQNPSLMLLDCPLAGLDTDTRGMFEDLFAQIAKSGTCLIMATNADQIPKVVTHVACLTPARKLRVYPRDRFCHSSQNSGSQAATDENRLMRLVNAGHRQSFDLLVGMKNVRVAYDKTVILKNINWQIRQGQRWALSGPNGSGKSTLLSLINGDHPQAYANDIILFDRKRGSGESIWDIKKKIGFMSPELFQYFPARYTCLQVVESGFYDTLGVFWQSRKENRERAEHWMKIIGLSEVTHRCFSDVSAGQQRLCLLARALVKNPYLLLLDEPCQGLERSQQLAFQQLVDAMAAVSDLGLVYVTHHAEQLPACIDHTLHLGRS